MTCYCDDPDHEMCWDGTLNNYDPNCSCCRDTQREYVALKLAAIDRRENEEAWREQAPELGIHPDMFVKKSEREALGFFEEDRFV